MDRKRLCGHFLTARELQTAALTRPCSQFNLGTSPLGLQVLTHFSPLNAAH